VDGKQIGRLVAEQRKRLGLTQVELASQAKVGRSWLSLLEGGRINDPGSFLLDALASALGLTIKDLLDAPPVIELTPDEKDLVSLLRIVPRSRQQAFMDAARSVAVVLKDADSP